MKETYAEQLKRIADEVGEDSSVDYYNDKIKSQLKSDAENGYKSSLVSIPTMFSKSIEAKLRQDGFKTNLNSCNEWHDTYYVSWK